MTHRAIKNDGKTVRYVVGRAIPPGETLLIDESELRGLFIEAEAEADVDEPAEPDVWQELVDELRAATVAQITEALPDLSDEQLRIIERDELASESTRKGVLEALDKERLLRADLIQQIQEADQATLDRLWIQYGECAGYAQLFGDLSVKPNTE